MKTALTKLLMVIFAMVFSLNAQAIEKEKNPANILVTIQGVLARVETKKVQIRTPSGHLVYVPRQRVELRGTAIGSSQVSARMTLAELSNLNPFFHPHLPLEP